MNNNKPLKDNEENKNEYYKPDFKIVVKKKHLEKLEIELSTHNISFEIDTEFTIKGVDLAYIVISKNYDMNFLLYIGSKLNIFLWINSSIDSWIM